MASCSANHGNPECIPGSETCYYMIAAGFCDGECIEFVAVGTGVSTEVEGVASSPVKEIVAKATTKNYFIRMSEDGLKRAGVKPLRLADGVRLPRADVDCRFSEASAEQPS